MKMNADWMECEAEWYGKCNKRNVEWNVECNCNGMLVELRVEFRMECGVEWNVG